MPEIGVRQIRVCNSTGKPVEMEYVGVEEDGRINGHPGWLCLHSDED